MKFAYQRTGGPLVRWDGPMAPAVHGRGADARSLGEVESLHVTLPGAPEYIVMGDDQPSNLSTLLILGGLGYLAYSWYKGEQRTSSARQRLAEDVRRGKYERKDASADDMADYYLRRKPRR